MNKPNDGGPAFPTEHAEHQICGEPRGVIPHPGMTFRDYLAAKAMNSFLAACGPEHYGQPSPEVIAAWAYAQADAMIAERLKGAK